MTLAYVSSPLDRAHQFRTDEKALDKLRGLPSSRLVRIRDEAAEMDGPALRLAHGGISPDAVFLGFDDAGAAWFAGEAPADAAFMPLRTLMMEGPLDAATLSILAQARSLVGWHARHGFCANCGTRTQTADAGYRRICGSCKAEHFPRTDPVVIMGVKRGDRFLLGRQAAWPATMWSALAGFVEPGETIEQAVRREVFEETAIRVGDVRYIASQPWPHPSSLMIGMMAEAESESITIDPKELEAARWFSRDEIKLMLVGEHPEGLWASRPQAIAHQVIGAALRA
jgi:NAD+ diphosphatase